MHYSNYPNKVNYFNSNGELTSISFKNIFDCVKNIIEHNEFDNINRVGICGKHSIEWIISSLIGIDLGVELVAVPENLNNEDLKLNLDYLDIDLFFISSEILQKEYFKNKSYIIYDDFLKYNKPSSKKRFKDNLEFNIIAFTSGSTSASKLKAFRFDNSSTQVFINNFIKEYDISSQDNWVVCHSFSHIVHFEYILGALIFGYNVTLTEPLKFLLNTQKINGDILITVPSVYQNLFNILYSRLPKTGLKKKIIDILLDSELSQEKLKLIQSIRDYIYSDIKDYLGSFYKVMIIGAAPSSLELKNKLLSLGLSIYEGYGMSETNMISANTPKFYKIGSVGKVWDNIEYFLDDNSLIHVKTNPVRTTNYLNHEAIFNNDTFKEDGWVCTGDIGEIDDEGYLFIKGREKDILISNSGKNINTNFIEQKLSNIEGVGFGLIYGDGKPYLIALISPLDSQNKLNHQYLNDEISLINKSLEIHERIQKFIILNDALTIENELLTRSGKPRKQYIKNLYEDRIEQLYKN